MKKEILYNVEVKNLNTLTGVKNELKQVKTAMENVDTSTEEGRKEFQKLEQSAAALKNRLDDSRRSLKNQSDALKVSNRSLDGMRARLKELVSKRNGLPVASKEFNRTQKEIANLNGKISKLEQQGGDFRRNVGNYQSALQNVAPGFANLAAQINAGTRAAIRFIATPIGAVIAAIVAALAALSSFFRNTQRGSEEFGKRLAQIQAALDVFTDRISLLGESLFKLFSGDIEGAAKTAKDAVSGITEELKEEVKLAGELKEEFYEIQRMQADLIVDEARRRRIIEANRLIAEDETKSYQERIKALNIAAQEEENIANKKMNVIREQIQQEIKGSKLAKDEASANQLINDIIAGRKDLTVEDLGMAESQNEELQKAAQLVADLINAQEEQFKRQRSIITRRNALEKKAAQENKEIREAELEELNVTVEEDPRVKRAEETYDKLEELGDQYTETLREDLDNQIEAELQAAKDREALERLNQKIRDESIQAVASSFGRFSELFERHTVAFKALAITEATISTFLAAANTLKNLTTLGAPPPIPQIAAGSIVASGLAAVARIANADSSTGGGLSTSAVQLTSETQTTRIDPRQLQALAQSIASAPAPVVSVEDINRTQNRVRVKESQGSL